ncbi:MAG: calcium-binding protein [Phenylobacterium sp.]
MATFTAGVFGNNLDQLDIGVLVLGQVSGASSTSFTITIGPEATNFSGSGFVFGPNGFPTAGTINSVTETNSGQPIYTASGFSVSTSTFFSWVTVGDNEAAKTALMGGADLFTGSPLADLLRGYAGNDTINAGEGANYVRGDEGDDLLNGGSGFDDINGNIGNDTVSTGAGDDYAVGGKDNDSLSGGGGSDVVWGNLGNDTQDGGDGNDQVRGGQGDDSITGGAGNDYVSGDRGADTIAGGTGADNFHGSQDAGIDRVIDFNLAEGDRVQLDPGTTYTLKQIGADTVLDMGGGHQMILVGIPMSSLGASSIFFG